MPSPFSFRLSSIAAAVVLAAPGPALAQALETIIVEGTALAPVDSSDRVFLATPSSATKTDTAVLATPQSITTVTRRQLDQQSPRTVGEALRYTAGVLSDRDSNTRYDSVFLRGFGAFGTATNYAHFLDGLKLPRGQAFAQTATDPYLLDRLEVLKGPSAVLYGQIGPGGLVNQISRRPSAEPAGELRLEGGTDGRLQGGLSSRGALAEDGSLQYGISAVGRQAGTRYGGVDEERFGIAPALAWQPDADTLLTISGYYQKDPEGGYFNSLHPRALAPAAYQSALNRRLDIGDPAFDAFEREQSGIGYRFERRLNDAATLRSNLRHARVETDFRSLQMTGPIGAGGLIPRQALRSIEDARGLSLDNQAEFRFDTGAIGHVALAGLDYQNSTSDWRYLHAAAPSLDVVDPEYGQQPIGPLAAIIDSGQKLRQTGLYLQDQLSLGGWRAVLGARRDWTRQDSDNRLAGTSSPQSSEATSYRAGLLYLFGNGLAPYASYSTSFEPTVGVDAGGAPFVPSKARQYEAGLKYQPRGLDALFTVSAFDIRQREALVPDSLGFSVQEGEIRSRGVEFEARGRVARQLELIGALTLLDTSVERTAVAAHVGNWPQAVPAYFGSLWANHRLGGLLTGLTLGGGLRVVGSSYADNANTFKAGGYTLVDAALRYDFGVVSPRLAGLEGTLDVTNLLDRDYYASCSSDIYCQFGNGRQVLAGLRYRW